jgi:hypothetical protein
MKSAGWHSGLQAKNQYSKRSASNIFQSKMNAQTLKHPKLPMVLSAPQLMDGFKL